MVIKIKYVISGCTGCIGISLINRLNVKTNNLTVILNPGSKRNALIEGIPNLRVLYAGLGQYNDVKIEDKKDVFIHLAWSGGLTRDDFEENQFSSFATVDALTLAQKLGCKKFISIGSQAEYGVTNEIITEKLQCFPSNEFGIAKLNTYFRLRAKASDLGIKMSWLRVLSAYGPFDRSSSMIMSTINSLLEGRDVGLSDCLHHWDFLHSDDIADAIIGLSKEINTKDLYVIGSDENFILKDYVKEMIKGFDIDDGKIFGKIQVEEKRIVRLQSNSSLLRNDIGWHPKIRFSSGIKDLFERERNKRLMIS